MERAPAPLRQPLRAKRLPGKDPGQHAPPPPTPIPAWARASGRAGEPLFAAGAGLALLDAFLRAEPPAAGALSARLALQSAAACAKILRLNADEAALRDLRFAAGDPRGPAATLLSLWSEGAGGPPSLDPSRIFDAAERIDLVLPDPNGLAAGLKACTGEGDPVSAAGDGVSELTRTETFALTAIAYQQPVTRGEISKLAAREISRDVIAALKRRGLIDGAIRAPQPGAPFAYVTTRKFLEVFGFASLRDLPDLEQLKAEGLLRRVQGEGDLDSAGANGRRGESPGAQPRFF